MLLFFLYTPLVNTPLVNIHLDLLTFLLLLWLFSFPVSLTFLMGSFSCPNNTHQSIFGSVSLLVQTLSLGVKWLYGWFPNVENSWLTMIFFQFQLNLSSSFKVIITRSALVFIVVIKELAACLTVDSLEVIFPPQLYFWPFIMMSLDFFLKIIHRVCLSFLNLYIGILSFWKVLSRKFSKYCVCLILFFLPLWDFN